jgi:peroxiredoxin
MRVLISFVAGLSLAGVAMAQTPTQAPATAPAPVLTVKPGDAAPAFSLQGSDGKTHSLAEFAGKKAVVLAWYPKAFTGG